LVDKNEKNEKLGDDEQSDAEMDAMLDVENRQK
jgi:hypothetical protein